MGHCASGYRVLAGIAVRRVLAIALRPTGRSNCRSAVRPLHHGLPVCGNPSGRMSPARLRSNRGRSPALIPGGCTLGCQRAHLYMDFDESGPLRPSMCMRCPDTWLRHPLGSPALGTLGCAVLKVPFIFRAPTFATSWAYLFALRVAEGRYTRSRDRVSEHEKRPTPRCSIVSGARGSLAFPTSVPGQVELSLAEGAHGVVDMHGAAARLSAGRPGPLLRWSLPGRAGTQTSVAVLA